MKLCLLVIIGLAMFAAMGQSAQAANPVVVMETNMGTIKIELDEEKAPVTVKNFLEYVDAKHYDGMIFHRVIKGFMIQGGGYDENLRERATRKPIKNESTNGLENKRGSIAMARTNDPDSATAQFFINTVNNPNLDRSSESAGYCVFGRVVEGMDVVDKIREGKTGSKGMFRSDVPLETVTIKSVKRLEAK